MNPSEAKYTRPAIALHWVMSLLIIGTFCFGVYMVDLPFSPARVRQFNWHKWAGITILLLACLRLLWRLGHKPPALPPETPRWQVFVASATHIALYGLFFAIPLLGWAYSSAAGFPVVWFGVVPLPDWIGVNPELAKSLKLFHRFAAYGLAALVVMHVAAALKHQFVDRDGLLKRML